MLISDWSSDVCSSDLLMLARSEVAWAGEHREVLEAYRMFADDRGWMRRMHDAVRGGLTAEAAVQKIQNETRARMTALKDPYLRARPSAPDDLAHRLLHHLLDRKNAEYGKRESVSV